MLLLPLLEHFYLHTVGQTARVGTLATMRAGDA